MLQYYNYILSSLLINIFKIYSFYNTKLVFYIAIFKHVFNIVNISDL